jgi:ATP-binding cassette subfamily F protein uup
LFTKQLAKFQKASDALVARQIALGEAEDEWLMLEEKGAG